jgi:hypothetical protein
MEAPFVLVFADRHGYFKHLPLGGKVRVTVAVNSFNRLQGRGRDHSS